MKKESKLMLRNVSATKIFWNINCGNYTIISLNNIDNNLSLRRCQGALPTSWYTN